MLFYQHVPNACSRYRAGSRELGRGDVLDQRAEFRRYLDMRKVGFLGYGIIFDPSLDIFFDEKNLLPRAGFPGFLHPPFTVARLYPSL